METDSKKMTNASHLATMSWCGKSQNKMQLERYHLDNWENEQKLIVCLQNILSVMVPILGNRLGSELK